MRILITELETGDEILVNVKNGEGIWHRCVLLLSVFYLVYHINMN